MAALVAYIMIMAVAAAASFVFSRSWKYGAAAALCCSLLAGLLAWLVWLRPYVLTSIVPIADAIYVANLFPLAVAIAVPAAVLLAKTRWQKLRIALLMVLLLTVSFLGTYRLLAGDPADTGPTVYFPDGTCRQTSIDTCSAAATVTLLKQHGITAGEPQIAHLALTKEGRGTHPLGIYRALKISAKESTAPLEVVYKAIPAEQLLKMGSLAIVNVGLLHQPKDEFETDLVQKYQWEPGVVHSVVLLGMEGNKVKIADPDFGVELWDIKGFKALYTGVAIMLRHSQD